MNEQRNNGRGIFYGVIGVATLVVAIIGATFAYFTATASNNIITGNMATVRLSLEVEKVTDVDVEKGGMIPMSNGMVETAVQNDSNHPCVDDNGNAVCQIYKITLTNASSAGQFVDGYVALKGGSGEPKDFTDYVAGAKVDKTGAASDTSKGTTMRWAQVFEDTAGKYKEGEETKTETDYTTAGDQVLGAASEKVTFSALGNTSAGHDTANIRTKNELMNGENAATGVLSETTISGSTYKVIGTNYIRVSNHAWTAEGAQSYDRTADVTSALVFNHNIPANTPATYYIVVWLSETGTNQTAGSAGAGAAATAADYFNGNVTFVSAQGSEVSATFSGYTRVESDQVNKNQEND